MSRNSPALAIVVLVLFAAVLLLFVWHPESGMHPPGRPTQAPTPASISPHPTPSAPKPPKPVNIVLDFAGDCTFGSVNGDSGPGRFPTVYRESGEKDYPFHLVHQWFDHDDLTVVNFECTLTDASATADKQWHFKGPANYTSIFHAGSVDVAGIANNHSHDYLQAGFDDTLANFKKAHIPTFYQNTPYITTIKGVQIVLIADCTVVGENTTVIDGAPNRVLAQIRRYKKPNNLVIVFMHWGSELDKKPRSWQQDLGHRFVDAGADAVIGAHPHVVQGIENYKGKTIAYSLGNFAFGGNSHARFPETFVLRLTSQIKEGRLQPPTAIILPCLTTSSGEPMVNNYQPKPLSGANAHRLMVEVVDRSAGLKYGIHW